MSTRGKFFTHLMSGQLDQGEVRMLFRNSFYEKVLNAVVVVKDHMAEGTYKVWAKSPCQYVPPKLTNVWTMSTGMRLVKIGILLQPGPRDNGNCPRVDNPLSPG